MNYSLIGNVGNSKKRLVIGLDFGAAFSKVVIGDNRVRYAVPFAEFAHPDNQYLLPSILNTDKNNLCTLTSVENADNTSDNLKLPLLDTSCSNEDLLRIVAYLALVFRLSKSWLIERYGKRYGGSELSWSINASQPAENLAHPELSDRYQQVLLCAWNLSVLPGPITLTRVRQFMGIDLSAFDKFPAVYRSRIINESAINIYSGCYAQICAYVHSTKCSNNLHMLIDVGAASISVATFMVGHGDENSNQSRCTLYACAVEPIGVAHLLKRRYENLQLPDGEINLFSDIPDNHTFSQRYDLTEKDIKFADTLYSGDAAKLINRVMALTKKQYCPDSSHWESGVLTLTNGGGAHLEIVQNIIQRLENKSPPNRITSINPAAPDDLMAENLPAGSYARLSVAYGLSFELDAIAGLSAKDFIADDKEAAEA